MLEDLRKQEEKSSSQVTKLLSHWWKNHRYDPINHPQVASAIKPKWRISHSLINVEEILKAMKLASQEIATKE